MSFLAVMRGVIAVGLVAGAATSAYSGWLQEWFWPPRPSSESPNEQQVSKGETNMSVSAQPERKVHHVGEADFEREVLQAAGPVLVDFYADWCGPCKLLAPVLEELAREAADVKVVKVNVDHAPGLASRYRVNSIPTLVVFRDGQAKTGTVGLASKSQLRSLLEQ